MEHDQASELQRDFLQNPRALSDSFCCAILGYSRFPAKTLECPAQADLYHSHSTVLIPNQIPETNFCILRCNYGHVPITHCVDTSLFYCRNVSAHPIRVCQLVSPTEQFHASARGVRISTTVEDSAKNK